MTRDFAERRAEKMRELKIKDAADGDTYAAGDLFEEFAMNYFSEIFFELIDFTPRREDLHGRYCERSKYPDFRFREKMGAREFWVECKYRRDFTDGNWIYLYEDPQKLKNLKEFREKTGNKVIFIIGVGGDPNDPQYVYLVDLDSINNNRLGLMGFLFDRLYRAYDEPFDLESLLSSTTGACGGRRY